MKSRLVIWALLIWLAGCQQVDEREQALDTFLANVPDTLEAGQFIKLGKPTGERYVVIQNSYQTLVFRSDSVQIQALYAGRYKVKLIDSQRIITQKECVVRPAAPQQATLFVGPKSIVANKRSSSMAILIPEDAYHNISLNTATFTSLRPNQQVETRQLSPYHILVYDQLLSQTLTGKTLISARIRSVQTSVREITEVAGEPVNFSLRAERVVPFADGNQYFTVKTDVLKDEYGNIVEDGTLVDLDRIEQGQVNGGLTAYTHQGVASWSVLNPVSSGTVVFQARVGKAVSNRLPLIFSDKRLAPVALDKL